MTSNTRPATTPASTPRSTLGVLAVSIAAALIAGLLMFTQVEPIGVQAAVPAPATPPAPRRDADASRPRTPALDADVDWHRVEPASEGADASIGAYER